MWLTLVESPPTFIQCNCAGVCLLVCGPVDVGKSTLCRYLVNYLLNRWPVVAYVDLDMGQTEFTVPGVVSLHLLTEPVLGPPMSHLRKPTKLVSSHAHLSQHHTCILGNCGMEIIASR